MARRKAAQLEDFTGQDVVKEIDVPSISDVTQSCIYLLTRAKEQESAFKQLAELLARFPEDVEAAEPALHEALRSQLANPAFAVLA